MTHETACDDTFSFAEIQPADINPSSEELSTRLKLLRDAAGFSQRELAKRAGVTNSSISMLEQAQVSPSIQSLGRILAAFPISFVDFFSFGIDAAQSADLNRMSKGSGVKQLSSSIDVLNPGQTAPFSAILLDVSGVVIEGEIQLTTLNGQSVLMAGESFYLTARQLYRLSNVSSVPARVFRCSLFTRNA